MLSFWNLGFGLPFLFRPDEDVMVGRAVRMAVEGSLDPLFYVYPPLAFDVFAAAQWVAGHLPGGRLGPATAVDPAREYLAARTVSALAQVAAVAATSLSAARAYGARAGVVAGAALAVAPLAVREAHFATTDALQLGLVAAAMWAAMRAGSARGFALAGAIAGAAASAKYTGGAVLAFVLVQALWGRPRRGGLANAAVAAGAAAAVFGGLIALTGRITDYPAGLAFLGGRAAEFANMPPGWLYHPTRSLPFGLGPGAYALCAAGVAAAAWRRTRTDVALLAYLVAAFLPIAASHEVYFRYALPLLPALSMLGGRAVALLPPRLVTPGLVAAGLLLVPSLWNSAAADRLLGATDTRAQAAAWLETNAPAGSAVVVGNYWGEPYYSAADLPENRLRPYYVSGNATADSFQQGRYTTRFTTAAEGSPCYRLEESGPPWQAPAPTGDLARFSPGRPGTDSVYDPLDSFWVPIWGFDGLDRPGPAIAVRAC